ncbi:MAG: hypothetical protein IH808_09240 [Proteobacteria bacterium]|nr:hypothetical protein [Pseudomonadota bacterium]
MSRMDNFYMQRAAGVHGKRFQGDTLPSDFFRSNIFIGFQEDELGIQLRHHIGVDNLLWGSDYPHAESTFPKSREILERILAGIPEEETWTDPILIISRSRTFSTRAGSQERKTWTSSIR